MASLLARDWGTLGTQVSELQAAVKEGILSPVQVATLRTRCQQPTFWTYQLLGDKFKIKREEALRHAIIRTAYGLYWEPGMTGGQDPYLSRLDRAKFHQNVLEQAGDLNCITRRDALLLACDLLRARRKTAASLLRTAAIKPPFDIMEVEPPSPEWLNGVARELELKICAPQELEAARRQFCDHAAIRSFFVTFADVIAGRDPRLVFNMDETQLSARKRFRVLTGSGHLPLVKAESKLPHITGVCTISAAGTVFRPIIILKRLKSLKSLSSFVHLASFASSESGWITGDLFAMFAIDFCAQLSVYRLTLPPELANKSVLLILDGHATRGHLLALLIFSLFDVDVLILPGHTTHVPQALDVAINSPLKTEFKRLLRDEVFKVLETLKKGDRSKADMLRCRMVEAFLNAFSLVTTPQNLHSAFEATGFVPFNPNRPHESRFLANGPSRLFEGIVQRPNSVNSQLLTDHEALRSRFFEQTRRVLTDEDLAGINVDQIWRDLMNGTLEKGRVLTPRRKIWRRTGANQIKAI
jgi:hypothetical protein